ncbi:MAG TPA: hypothetical protein VL400_01105, partial [Polyangiaceae bacterium]|nr:hypothetical protein [Polyangiaceae bacterium]
MTSARTSLAALLVGFTVAACGGSKEPVNDMPPPGDVGMQPTATAEPTALATAEPTAPPAPQLPPVELTEGTASAAPEKMPTVAIKAPTANQVIAADKAADFEVKLDVKGWEGSDGRHVHLILDGKPYMRIDDPKKPIKLKDLDPSGALAEGQHVLVAFPSRHTHESIKPAGKTSPLAVATFWIGKKGTPSWKPTDPTLVYSRPKGANDGPPPPEGLLVDFYLANAELGDGKFSVEATLTGPGAESGIKSKIKDWKPWRIHNVRDGKYSLHLVLLDKDGKPVPGAWNDSTHDFTVDTTKPPPPPPPPP